MIGACVCDHSVSDGDDGLADIEAAIHKARLDKARPSLIQLRYVSTFPLLLSLPNSSSGLNLNGLISIVNCRTTIGYGSKDQGTHAVHGNALKKDDTSAIKTKFGFNPEEFFAVPAVTTEIYAAIGAKGAAIEAKWEKNFAEYCIKFPEEANDIKRRISGTLPEGWEAALPRFTVKDEAVATRKLSETLLAKLSVAIPELMSGSADLTPSVRFFGVRSLHGFSILTLMRFFGWM